MQVSRGRLEQATAGLPDLPSLLATARMRLDDRSQRLELALPAYVMRIRSRLDAPLHQLPSPELIVSRARAALTAPFRQLPSPVLMIERRGSALQKAETALVTVWQNAAQRFHLRVERQRLSPETLNGAIRLQKARLAGLGSHLEAVSPKAILSRGYVLVQDSKGRPVTSSNAAPVNDRVVLSFADGERGAKLDALTSQGDLGL